jgi:hypothetical protein
LTLDVWVAHATRDAEARKLPALVPMLETLARATALLRAADWNPDASAGSATAAPSHGG